MKPKKIKINTTITKPLLAETVESLSTLSYPVLVSPKLDGIRCLVIGGKALTRKFEPVPNHYVRNWIEENLPDGFDGELCVDGKTFNETQSLIMTEEGEPDFNLSLFDCVTNNNLAERFEERYKKLVNYTKSIGKEINSRVRLVKHYIANNEQEVLKFEQQFLDEGYEGLMIRSLDGWYKCGRSSIKEGILLKLKRFTDSEAIVLSIYPRMKNNNVAQKDNLGNTKRSKHKANLVTEESLGGFSVRDLKTGCEFDIGTGEGLTHELRKEFWDNRENLIGKIVKYKHQLAGSKKNEDGSDGNPRFPVWLGFRDPRDMS